MLLGLSLSMCVKDIIEDRVSIDDVTCLITGTHVQTDSSWDEVIKGYCETYWRKAPVRAKDIVSLLRWSDRIVQPRRIGQQPPYVHKHHWVNLWQLPNSDWFVSNGLAVDNPPVTPCT